MATPEKRARLILRTHPLQRSDLDDFVACFHPENRHVRRPTWSEQVPGRRWRAFASEELVQGDTCSLDVFRLEDESLEEPDNLPEPDVIAAEIAKDLRAALEQFAEIQADLTHARASADE